MSQYHFAVLGHVDAGKTSLVRAIHENVTGVVSTAALDKAPESQQRGITMDLGMSCVLPSDNCSKLICLVDCPGHSSLLSTTLGGTSIVDSCLLIIDANTGPQAQTLECYVVAELLYKDLIVVLTKVDKLDHKTKAKKIDKLRAGLTKIFHKFSSQGRLYFCAVSSHTGEGIPDFISTLQSLAQQGGDYSNDDSVGAVEQVLFSYDHAFNVPGQGPIVTGRLLQGELKINDTLLCANGDEVRVKGIQCFKESVEHAARGARVAINLPKLRINKINERGFMTDYTMVSSQWYLAKLSVSDRAAEYFQKICVSNLSNDADVALLEQQGMGNQRPLTLSLSVGHEIIETALYFMEPRSSERGLPEYKRVPMLTTDSAICLLKFKHGPRRLPLPSRAIGLRLDIPHKEKPCRILCSGMITQTTDPSAMVIYRSKSKEAHIESITKTGELRCVGCFLDADHVMSLVGAPCHVGSGGKTVNGRLDRHFGKNGKFIVVLDLCGGDPISVVAGDMVVIEQRLEVTIK